MGGSVERYNKAIAAKHSRTAEVRRLQEYCETELGLIYLEDGVYEYGDFRVYFIDSSYEYLEPFCYYIYFGNGTVTLGRSTKNCVLRPYYSKVKKDKIVEKWYGLVNKEWRQNRVIENRIPENWKCPICEKVKTDRRRWVVSLGVCLSCRQQLVRS